MPKGNREEALRLLETTTKTMKQINEETGVPVGTLGYLAKKHRPQSVSEANMKKNHVPKGSNKPGEKGPGTVVSVDTETRTHDMDVDIEPVKEQGDNTVIDFNFYLGMSGQAISKEEAIGRLRNTIDLLELLESEKVTFRFKVGS